MPHEPTALEKKAASLEVDALARVDDAISHILAAERALLEEERQHAPHVGIGNQYKLIAYADILTVMGEAQRQIMVRLTGASKAAA